MRARKPRWGIYALVVFAFLVLCAGGGFLVGFGPVDIAPASRDVVKAEAEYRAAGWPWEAKDLTPAVHPPADQNAALPIKEAVADPHVRNFNKDRKAFFDDLAAQRWDSLANRLKAYEPGLALAREAAKRPQLDFGRDWDLGPYLLFPELVEVKSLVNLLTFNAHLRIARHRLAEAAKDLECAWKLSQDVGQEPTLIAMLVEVACQAVVLHETVGCAAQLKGDLGGLEALQKTVQNLGDPPDFMHSLRGEAYMGITITRNFSAFGGFDTLKGSSGGDAPPKIDPSALQRTGLPRGMWARAFLDRHLRDFIAIKGEFEAHPGDPEKISADMDLMSIHLTEHRTLSGILEEILLPVFSQAGQTVVTDQARRVTTQALLSALILQARTGQFPTSIGAVPGTWTDPFTKTPLRLKATADSIRIYSLGPDRKDEGGLDQAELKTSSQDYDIVAAYPPVKRRG